MLAGELFEEIQRKGKLTLDDARFYAAEIVQILSYLREQKVCKSVYLYALYV